MGWCPACISPSRTGGEKGLPVSCCLASACALGSFRDEQFPHVPMFGGWSKGKSECSSLGRMTCRCEPWKGCWHLAATGEATGMTPTQQQGQSRRLKDNQARGPQCHRLLSPGSPRLPVFEAIALYFLILINSEHLIELITFFPTQILSDREKFCQPSKYVFIVPKSPGPPYTEAFSILVLFSFPDKTLLPCFITRGPNIRNFSFSNRSFSGAKENGGPGRQQRARHDDRSSRSELQVSRQSRRSRARGRMQMGVARTGSQIGLAGFKPQRPLLSGRVI